MSNGTQSNDRTTLVLVVVAVWGAGIEPRLIDEEWVTARVPGLPSEWEGTQVAGADMVDPPEGLSGSGAMKHTESQSVRRLTLVVFALTAAACSAAVQSGSPAAADPGIELAGADAGVRLEVHPGMQHPREVNRPVTALFVVVENRSQRDLVIRPGAFYLVSASGRRYPAIPADDLRESRESSLSADVAIAMRALPHDPLGAGGRTDGFLYFDETADAGPLTLTFELRAQDDGVRFGLITVPLTLNSNACGPD